MQLQLRPLGIGEILTASLIVYRRRWRTLLAIAGILILPYAVLYLALADPPAELPVPPTNEQLTELLSSMAPWLLVRLLILTVMLAAVIRMVVETYVDVDSTWRQSAAAAISRMLGLTVVSVLFWSVVILGSALFVLPGIFFMVAFSACLPVFMIEGADPLAALSRSWRMTAGRRWQVFGVLVVASVFVLLASTVTYLALGTVLYRLQGDFGLMLASELAWVAIQPFIGVSLAVMYLDLRVRKEDLDADWLSLQIAATSFEQ